MNPMDILKSIKDPKEFVNNYVRQNNNPILNNLVQMAQQNDVKGLENFARNFLKGQGRDFDQEYSTLLNMFK